MPNVSKILLTGLRRRGFILTPGPDWRSLFLEPFSLLTEADRTALREHREAVLDLLWEDVMSPYLDNPLGWLGDLPELYRGMCVPWEESDHVIK